MYKAVDPNGNSFHDSSVHWVVGEVTRHPSSTKMVPNYASTYLSASTEPADCTGFSWPCRLFEVEPAGETLTGLDYPYKVAALAFRVVRELPAWQSLGPNGEAVAALIERCKTLTSSEIKRLAAAGAAAWDAAWAAAWAAAWDAARAAVWAAAREAARDAAAAAAREAAWDAARAAAGDAAGDAAWDAAGALLVKDKIAPEQFNLLTKPWRSTGLAL